MTIFSFWTNDNDDDFHKTNDLKNSTTIAMMNKRRMRVFNKPCISSCIWCREMMCCRGSFLVIIYPEEWRLLEELYVTVHASLKILNTLPDIRFVLWDYFMAISCVKCHHWSDSQSARSEDEYMDKYFCSDKIPSKIQPVHQNYAKDNVQPRMRVRLRLPICSYKSCKIHDVN
jgi:hypothetical protein